MLKLRKIVKIYQASDMKVEALRGIDLSFRKNEFVSILGPSGCGKTTLLNIIGGLDNYTSGDLIIAGKSTKDFKDKDWDVYRNHRIGFVFQSYNLIPHQTILQNVELALTIGGLSKEERQAKAKKALDKVGLEGMYNKRPNQLSGGQCQRVAIARALVNEPDILLADEPTGALDTKTSVQIMDLIKEISKDKLVIMVTHNPELAEKYSTRIVKLLDGLVIEDSNPFSEEDEYKETQVNVDTTVQAKKNKAKMSWWTAFKLSARNLLSKSKRTILTCIAGSIGIVGISVVLAVSSGVKGYIASMQDDMLSGNPITIDETAYDLAAFMGNMSTGEKMEVVKDHVNVESLLEYFAKNLTGDNAFVINNEITEDYVNYLKAMPEEYYQALVFRYGVNLSNNIYTDFKVNDSVTMTPSLTTIKSMYTSVLQTQPEYAQYANMILSLANPISQVIPNEEYILEQYDLEAGHFPTNKNELLLVVGKDQSVNDLVLAQLGYYTQEEFLSLAMNSGSPDNKLRFSYDELMNKSFYYYHNNDLYSEGTATPTNISPYNYNAYMDKTNAAEELKVVGILKPKSDLMYGSLTSGFYYTEELTQEFISDSLNSEIILAGKEAVKNINESSEVKMSEDDFRYGITITQEINGVNITINYMKISYNYTYYKLDGTPVETVTDLTASSSGTGLFGSMIGGSGFSANGPSIRELGGNNLPNGVSIYPNSFEEKFLVTDYLDLWNQEGDIVVGDKTISFADRNKVTYTDNLELVINLINNMIDIVTVALICFTALSLVVSCVMIAIITYVSVMERVKEIGVIRSLGGRKKDVSNLFNAETMIIGTIAGGFGILITYIISIVANVIVNAVVGVYPIAALPWWQAVIMILVSIVLNAISGFIPARSAAKKDPANALRTE